MMQFSRVIKKDMNGDDVFYIKNKLFALGYYTDDIKEIKSKSFGNDSVKAVNKYRRDFGLKETGEVDEAVWNMLDGDLVAEKAPSNTPKLDEFIAYLNNVVNRGIYVWGGQTQVIKGGRAYKKDDFKTDLGAAETWIKSVETSTNNANRVIKLYNSRKSLCNEIPCFDCSGLGMNFLYNIKGYATSDMTANGMKGKCAIIDKSQLKRGDWVFRTYTSGADKGRAYHIGYVVDDALNVVEAYGRDKGVIKRAFDSSYWNTYGRPSYFSDEIGKSGGAAPSLSFSRVLKKTSPLMQGEDVKALQKMLNEANGAGLAVDGQFGSKSEEAVKKYQKIKGLTVDGKAGKNTITALGGKWIG